MPDVPNINMEYKTWYDFKRAIESKLGRGLPVDLWLRTKPKKALPWDDVDLRTTLSAILIVQESLRRESNRFVQVKMHK
jgi:hypothetical protein